MSVKDGGNLEGQAASARIDQLIAELGDWRGEKLAEVREIMREAVPDLEETWKWRGSPSWEWNGIIAVGNALKAKIKLTFPHGAELDDPEGLFNNGFAGKYWRSIDMGKTYELDRDAFRRLWRRAADYNLELMRRKGEKASS